MIDVLPTQGEIEQFKQIGLITDSLAKRYSVRMAKLIVQEIQELEKSGISMQRITRRTIAYRLTEEKGYYKKSSKMFEIIESVITVLQICGVVPWYYFSSKFKGDFVRGIPPLVSATSPEIIKYDIESCLSPEVRLYSDDVLPLISIEKSSATPVLDYVNIDVPVIVWEGTFQHSLLYEFIGRIPKETRKIVVIHLGDANPQGDYTYKVLANVLRANGYEVEAYKVALTPEQCIELNIPAKPEVIEKGMRDGAFRRVMHEYLALMRKYNRTEPPFGEFDSILDKPAILESIGREIEKILQNKLRWLTNDEIDKLREEKKKENKRALLKILEEIKRLIELD